MAHFLFPLVAESPSLTTTTPAGATRTSASAKSKAGVKGVVQGNLHKFYVLFTQKANCIFSTTRTPFNLTPPPPTHTHTHTRTLNDGQAVSHTH